MRNSLVKWLIFLQCIFSACNKTGTDFNTGDIIGFVELHTSRGNQNPSDIQATLTIENPINYISGIRTLTDSDGMFRFKDIDRGTYNLILEKDGYAKCIYYGIQHLGGDPTVLGDPVRDQVLYLVSVPDGLITTFTVESSGKFQIEGTVSPSDTSAEIGIYLFMSNLQDIDNNNWDYVEVLNIPTDESGFHNDEFYNYILHIQDKQMNYPPGTTLYIKAYLGNYMEYYNYRTLNFYDGRYYYFSLNQNASQTVNVIYE